MVNSSKLLTIVAMLSILDICKGSGYASIFYVSNLYLGAKNLRIHVKP